MTKETMKLVLSHLGNLALFFAGLLIGWIAFSSNKPETITEERVVTQIVEQPMQLDPWQVLQMAIIKTESEFNTLAVGSSKDLGIFQITPIYVDECNRILGKDVYKATDAFNIDKSLEMFAIIQDHHNPTHDSDRAIRKHNPGGESIGYAKKVYENVAWIQRMENVRRSIIAKK